MAEKKCNCPVPGLTNEYKCDDAQQTPFPSHCPCWCHKVFFDEAPEVLETGFNDTEDA
jgi:hypothetical protein